jgi:hypothetical protein
VPIDLDRIHAQNPSIRYDKLVSHVIDGIEVAWMSSVGKQPDGSIHHACGLYTDCDFRIETIDGRLVRVSKNDEFDTRCREALKKAQELWFSQTRKVYPEWAAMDIHDAILDIFRRVSEGTWLGQRYPKMIYAQEVAKLLGVGNPNAFTNAAFKACAELEEQEKLALHGSILAPYVARFRFPIEIQDLLRYIIEEPLGWPNGEAGDCALSVIEATIGEYTQFKHGKNLVHAHNFPHIAPHHLVHFGLVWIHRGVEGSLNDPTRPGAPVNLTAMAAQLEKMAKQLREAGSAPKTGST